MSEETQEQEESSLFKPMTEDELAAVCHEEISRGIGGNVSSDSDPDITLALDYYFGRLPGLTKMRAKDKNASRFISQDVMDAVEATVSEIMPAFTTDQVGIFEPEDERDEDASQKETDIVNYLLMEEYDGFELIQKALRDSLLHKNCTAKVYWEEKVSVEFEEFEDVPEMALAELLTPQQEDQEIEVVEQYVSEEADMEALAYVESDKHVADMQNLQQVQQVPEMQQQAQQGAQMMQQAMTAAQDKFSGKLKRITKEGRPVIKSQPPENVIVAGEHDTPMLDNARFSAIEFVVPKSELIAEGYDKEKVDSLPEYNSNVDNASRGRQSEEHDYTSAHESTRLVRLFDCYIVIDFDGDGYAEYRNVLLGDGNAVLENTEINSNSLVGGCTQIMPHKYKGVSMFERMKDIQDSKTPIMRSIIDGTQLSSNPRIGVVTGNGLNIDDVLTSRTGGVVRMENANSMVEIPNPQIPQSSYTFLEHMDNVRRDRGGGAVDSANTMQQDMGNSAEGTVNRVMTAMEMGNSLLAKTFGETFIRGIFLELHNILRMYHKGQITAKVGGRWMDTVPSQWRKRTAITIHVGSSHAERARQANVMNGVVMTQMGLKESGSILYSQDKHYQALIDGIRLAGIKNPDRYYLDPTSEQGQQAGKQQSEQQEKMTQEQKAMQDKMVEAQDRISKAEQLKAMADIQANQVKLKNEGLKNEITALKDQLQTATKQAELNFKYSKQADDIALKLTELEKQFGTDLSKQNEDNKVDNVSQ